MKIGRLSNGGRRRVTAGRAPKDFEIRFASAAACTQISSQIRHTRDLANSDAEDVPSSCMPPCIHRKIYLPFGTAISIRIPQ